MVTAFTFTDARRPASNARSADEAAIDRWTNEGGALRGFGHNPGTSGLPELPLANESANARQTTHSVSRSRACRMRSSRLKSGKSTQASWNLLDVFS
jgi:hypothetical protein